MFRSALSLVFFVSLQTYFLPASGECPMFQECAPFVCGDQQIGYPFRHDEQPDHCGCPGYELSCDGHNPILSMESLEYRVIHMNMSRQILQVARMDLSDDVCLGTHVNTTLNFSLFDYASSYFNSTLFYYCDSSLPTPPHVRFSCPLSGDGYFALDADHENPLHELCNFSVLVPISQSEAPGLTPPPEGKDDSAFISRANISEFLNKGFEVTWTANTSLCENCTKSGGRCGYDWTRQEFNCFCPDGPSSLVCNRRRVPGSFHSSM
ncbi:hypothetical protein ACJRO7_009980 [Eucalyptus globulus]|uniref:non-specific serine/threonine protein kinase n=1 Tax=Eucalyptus globulus TaxID=34317 RepID=A0ABD3LFE3_EUCGL